MSGTRISVGDVVETRSDGVQRIVTGRYVAAGTEVVALERPDGETLAIGLRGVRRIGRQVPLLDGKGASS